MDNQLTFADFVNSRQVAIGFWLVVFAGWALTNSKMRASLRSAGGMLLHWKISSMLTSMGAYVGASIWALTQIGAWSIGQIVDTVLWFLLCAAVLLSDVVTSRGSERILPRVIAKSVAIVVIVEFVVAFATFPLMVEFAFVPFLFLLGGLLAVTDVKSEHAAVHRMIVGLQGIVGFVILMAAAAKVVREWSSFASLGTVKDVIMAPVLSLALVPFLWFVSIVTIYEDLFLRHSLGPPKSISIRIWFVLRMLGYCRLSRACISGIRGRFPLEIMHAADYEAVRELIRQDRMARRHAPAGDRSAT